MALNPGQYQGRRKNPVRANDEWIGTTDDTPVPPRVKLRVFQRYQGTCYLSGRKIRPGDAWQTEHVIALCNGGENRETNLKPALVDPHKVKTAQDRRIKAKDDRVRQKHLGIKKKRRWPSRKFDGTVVWPK